MVKVFISGAYTPYYTKDRKLHDREENVARAKAIGLELVKAGFNPFIPHTMWTGFEDECQADYIEMCLEWMACCACVYQVDNYKFSDGAQQECQTAVAKELPVFDDMEEIRRYYVDRK